MNLAVEALLKRDEGLGLCYAGNVLDLVVEQLHEVLIVACVNLDEHGVRAGREVALHNLGNLLEFVDSLAVHRAFLKFYAYIGAGIVTQCLGIYVIARACDDFHLDEALDALMNCSTRNSAYNGNVFRCDAGIVHYDVQNLSVEIVYSIHDISEVVFRTTI